MIQLSRRQRLSKTLKNSWVSRGLLLYDQHSQCFVERLRKDWTAPVYGFYAAEVQTRKDANGRTAHVFACTNCKCKKTVIRYLDKSDAKSTSNLRKHVRSCWGEDALKAADQMETAEAARPSVEKYRRSGTITSSFAHTGKGKISYSCRQHTRSKARYNILLTYLQMLISINRAAIVRWVTQSMRLFTIVEDPGFHELMKTGRPEYYIPSGRTVSRDIHMVFSHARERIQKMIQVC